MSIRINGIISLNSRFDDTIIDPKGIDISGYLKNPVIIHQGKVKGFCDKVEVNSEKGHIEIEGTLHDELIKKHRDNIEFTIGGMVLDRDIDNPKKITKMNMTNVSIKPKYPK